jgi:hypothetical protein
MANPAYEEIVNYLALLLGVLTYIKRFAAQNEELDGLAHDSHEGKNCRVEGQAGSRQIAKPRRQCGTLRGSGDRCRGCGDR